MARRGAVRIEGLELECVIGVREDERRRTQPLLIDCEIRYRVIPGSEKIEEAIDYSVAAELIRNCAVEGRFQLLERLAQRAAELLLERFPVAESAKISVRKPEALAGRAIASVQVEVKRD